jgi:hypothetical protein
LASCTEEEVIPVWSLNALDGIFDPPLPAEVVVDDVELVELQATPVAPTSMTIPTAAMRIFHDAAIKHSPSFVVRFPSDRCHRHPGACSPFM